MATWSEGYFVDTNYTNYYYRELSPLLINLNLTLAGFDVPCWNGEDICPKEGFKYLELAFGCGASLNVHAATMQGDFVGTDFNPNQVAIAKSYQKDASNLTLYDYSFKELLEYFTLTQPRFDYICLHGIFSWISQENREIILEIIRKFLGVGGGVYISYNSMPGWAHRIPSRELLSLYRNYNDSVEFDAHTLTKNALGFSESFLAINPAFAGDINRTMLEGLKEQDLTYVAHEYFNENWDCFYFYQVAKMMESAKCSFVVQADLLKHFEVYNFTQEALGFLGNIKNDIFKEQLGDYYLNTQFRRDIYIKGVRRISNQQIKERLLKTSFALCAPVASFKDKMQFPLGEVSLSRDVHHKVLLFLESENCRSKSLEEIVESTQIDIATTLEAMLALVQQGIASPVQKTNEKLLSQARAYNIEVLKRQEYGVDNTLFIAAPKIATAILMGDMEQFIMHAYLQGFKTEKQLIEYVMRVFKENNKDLIKDGKILQNPKETRGIIGGVVKEFLSKIPIYQALGILE